MECLSTDTAAESKRYFKVHGYLAGYNRTASQNFISLLYQDPSVIPEASNKSSKQRVPLSQQVCGSTKGNLSEKLQQQRGILGVSRTEGWSPCQGTAETLVCVHGHDLSQ